jgi:hypothetical protein
MKCPFFLVASLLLLAAPEKSHSANVELWGLFANRFEYKTNYLNTDALPRYQFDASALGYYFYATGGLDVYFDNLTLSFSLDSGIIELPWIYPQNPPRDYLTSNGIPIADYARETLFIRELALEAFPLSDDALSMKFGKYLSSIGRDFIYNDFTFGAVAELDLLEEHKIPLQASLELITSDGTFTSYGKKSPILSAEIAYPFSKKERVGLFFAYFHDGDNLLGEILRPMAGEYVNTSFVPEVKNPKARDKAVNKNLQKDYDTLLSECGGNLANCLEIEDTADIFWAGLDFYKKYRDFSFSCVAMVNFGSATVNPYVQSNGKQYSLFGNTPQEVAAASNKNLLAFMTDLEVTWEFVKGYSISAFFLYLSGDGDFEKIDGNSIGTFISVMPYITRTDIFFNGGMNESASARVMSTSGINGHGALVPGLQFDLRPHKTVGIRAIGAVLLADAIDESYAYSKSKFYGWELDLQAKWSPLDFMDVRLEFDYLGTGAFFDHPQNWSIENPDTIVSEPSPLKVLVGLDFHYN